MNTNLKFNLNRRLKECKISNYLIGMAYQAHPFL